MNEPEMEYLPVTVDQAAKILLESMDDDEIKLIHNMDPEDLEAFNFFKDYSIVEKFGLEEGNLALLEDCTNRKKDNSPSDSFVILVTPEEAAKMIFEKTVEIISDQKFIQDYI